MVFFLEEPSAEELLRGILPKILPEGIATDFKIFEGKQDLEKRLPRILRAWRKPECLFLVMRDQDSGDCRKIKSALVDICKEAGKETLVRIACKEIESFYLGDLAAVEKGLGVKGLRMKQNTRKFRDPDKIRNAKAVLIELTKRHYQEISGSRSIAPHLSIEGNASHSFRMLVSGIRKLLHV